MNVVVLFIFHVAEIHFIESVEQHNTVEEHNTNDIDIKCTFC